MSFKAGGALTNLDIACYIERDADRQTVDYISQKEKEYVLLIESRQQGKSSLLNAIMRHSALKGRMLSVYIDMTALDSSTEQAWYQNLFDYILSQLQRQIEFTDSSLVAPTGSSTLYKFLLDLALLAQDAKKYVIIALDEVGAVPFSWSTTFYSILRAVYNSRQAYTEFYHLTFLFSGVFYPHDLIKDSQNSPFNVAKRVRLNDFTLSEVHKLLVNGNWTKDIREQIAARIFYWTDGQPYLTQLLAIYSNSAHSPVDVDKAVERLRREDGNHIWHIVEQLNKNPQLQDYLQSLRSRATSVRFYPSQNTKQRELELIGVLKADEQGMCQVRNRIYEQVLDSMDDSPKVVLGHKNRWAVLVGINEYKDKNHYGKLHVCTKDVKSLTEQLARSGYKNEHISKLIDESTEPPSRDNILTTLQAIASATTPEDLLLFYYSGHGDEQKGESYLVSQSGMAVNLRDTAVPLARVKEIMADAPALAKVIVIDACHSGENTGKKSGTQMSAEFIKRVFEDAEGMAILASCKQGEKSYEWREQEQSVFTHFLLDALAGNSDLDKKGFVTVQDVNRFVVDGVRVWASQRKVSQTPTLSYSVAGDIILAKYRG